MKLSKEKFMFQQLRRKFSVCCWKRCGERSC